MAGSKTRVPSEAQEGVALSAWLTRNGIAHVHVPNGIKIGGDRRGAAGQIACLKDQGLQPGAPDYLVFGPLPPGLRACGVAIELKTRDAPPGEPWGVLIHDRWLRPNQASWLERLSQLGALYEVTEHRLLPWKCRACAGAKVAIEWLQSLGFGRAAEVVEDGGMPETVTVTISPPDIDNAFASKVAAELAPKKARKMDEMMLSAVCKGLTEQLSGAEPLTIGQIAVLTGYDKDELKQALPAMVETGELVKTGARRGTRYALKGGE